MKQQRYALGAVVVAALLPFLGWATDWGTPGGPAGRLKPGPHGPFRNDPAQGIPQHAYSPFDPRNEPKTNVLVAGRDYLPGRVVVKLKSPAAAKTKAATVLPDVAALSQRFATHGVTSLDRVFPNAAAPALRAKAVAGRSDGKPDLTRWLRAKCADQVDILALVNKLGEDPDVECAEPDMIRRPAGYIPNGDADPLFASQWHLPAAHIPEAWAYLDSLGLPPGGNRDIVVAVIDTGVDYTHPDLAANMWTNSREIPGNGLDDDGNGFVDDVHGCAVVSDSRSHSGNPMDDHGHGTHVAGIIGAQAGNSIGVVGVAYNCQIMAIKAAQYSGVLSTSDIAEGIIYAVANGADIINMSFGGYGKSQIEEDALAVAFGQCVLVAAAGNDAKVNQPCPFGADMYPAAYNWVLGVMASKPGGGLADFSNYDCTPHDTHEYELTAPGVDIWSTLPNNQYAAWDGTSMAAPIVSGMAALLRTKWSDKDVYSSRFIMGQMAANAASGANALAALMVAPTPELSFQEHWLFDTSLQAANNDNDGRVDAGETIDLALVIRNHWGKASNVVVTLDAWAGGAFQADPYVTWLTNVVDYGAIGAFNWDDNGLIYSNQVITGVRYPFRFQVTNTCPNDHVIPFRVNMICRNGFDPTDTTNYTFQSRFNLVVQRGTQLPRIISTNMTLTKAYYWIVTGPTLVERQATVTVTEGTQVQWGAPDPNNPYGQGNAAKIQVEGTLLTQGTVAEPVELFPSPILGGSAAIEAYSGGVARLSYTHARTFNSGYSGITSVDHSYFDGGGEASVTEYLRNTIFRKPRIVGPGLMSTCLLDGGASIHYNVRSIVGTVFLQDNLNKIAGGWHIGGQGGVVAYRKDLMWLSVVGESSGNTYVVMTNAQSEGYCGQGFPGAATATEWEYIANYFGGHLVDVQNTRLELPGSVSQAYLDGHKDDAFAYLASQMTQSRENAFLSAFWDPNVNRWMRMSFNWYICRPTFVGLAYNYWGTESTLLIDGAVYDFNDDFNLGRLVYQPILLVPSTNTFPFVWQVVISSGSQTNTTVVGAEPVAFTVIFNRDMDTNVQPQVTFGPDMPVTDYTIHPVDGGWRDARTWMGAFNVNPITGDGYQLMRIAGGCAADDPWLVCGEDSGRFRFEIITSGTESMNLQATGSEGRVALSWMQDDFELLAGYNLYRSSTTNGTFARVNGFIIPTQTKSFVDTNVAPGQVYYYKFTVVKTDMAESDFSNVAQGTPLDTIPPVLTHTRVTSAAPGMPLTLFADVTDNVGVQAVTLRFRTLGATDYTSRAMTRTTGNRYATTLEGSRLVSPGVEYYIEASDGISTVRSGLPEHPWQVIVVDRPVVTVVTPNHGPAAGGTLVTIGGSNFKASATVSFGGVPAASVTVVSASQITCTNAAHFPAAVDVVVRNPDTQSGTLLLGYTYESAVASLSLPHTGGPRYGTVPVPINAANVLGLAAASVTVTFDSSVLCGRGALTGSLTPGWSVAVNTNTPGQLRLSLASPGSTATGSGVLAYLEFEVLGSPGATSPLTLTSVSLNDGAIQTETAAGSFAVNVVYDIRGTVSFWNGGAAVPGVVCTLQGDRVYTGTSGNNGTFTVAGADAGSYTFTPGKADGVNGISAYDASLVLQHDAGLITLSGHAATAADVNKSGQITAFDAFYVLQQAVDLITLPFPGAGQVWVFDPANRSYAGLSSSQAGQNFTAILLGDVSGNWSLPALSPLGGGSRGSKGGSPPVVLGLRSLTTRSNGTQLWLLANVSEPGLYSLDLKLRYNATTNWVARVQAGAFAGGLALAANAAAPGVVRAAFAGAVPLRGIGAMLLLSLTNRSGADFGIESAEVNEGAVAVVVDETQFDRDSDGDGVADWLEIRAGTDALDRSSLFAFKDVQANPDGSRVLTWSAVPGKQYQLLYQDEASAPDWLPVGGEITADGLRCSRVDTSAASAAHRLYRVRLLE